jgi:hypothetical protein
MGVTVKEFDAKRACRPRHHSTPTTHLIKGEQQVEYLRENTRTTNHRALIGNIQEAALTQCF